MPALSWAVLQLRDGIDFTIPLSTYEQEFSARWPGSIFKFPAVKQGRLDADNPMSGYVLVRPPVPPRADQSPLIATVLRDPASRRPLFVTDDDLAAMTPLPPFPPPGTNVLVTAGDYEGLQGVVCSVNCQTCDVLIELWSKQVVLSLAANELSRV